MFGPPTTDSIGAGATTPFEGTLSKIAARRARERSKLRAMKDGVGVVEDVDAGDEGDLVTWSLYITTGGGFAGPGGRLVVRVNFSCEFGVRIILSVQAFQRRIT